MRGLLIAGVAVGVAAGTAQAGVFSLASDTADRAWTWTGNGAAMTDATGPNDPLTLVIDDNNGVLPRLEVSVQFNASVSMTFVGDVPLGGGVFSHNYLANGTFQFIDIPSGVALLTTTFEGALFTARGGATSWFTTGAMQVDASGANVNMTWGGASLPGYGLEPGPLRGLPRGFAFDLTAINTNGSIPYNHLNPGVGLGANMLPNAQWWAESSYSSSANVPGPGAVALMTVGGLIGLRRRR